MDRLNQLVVFTLDDQRYALHLPISSEYEYTETQKLMYLDHVSKSQ
jgi:hypothetical protein